MTSVDHATRILPGSPEWADLLAQIGSGCESLNAALSAEELMISPRGHVILRDDPAVTSERSGSWVRKDRRTQTAGRSSSPQARWEPTSCSRSARPTAR